MNTKLCGWCVHYRKEGCGIGWRLTNSNFGEEVVDVDINTIVNCKDWREFYHQCHKCKHKSDYLCDGRYSCWAKSDSGEGGTHLIRLWDIHHPCKDMEIDIYGSN